MDACATMSGMSLTKGPGPLSTQPAGQTNYAIEGHAHRLLFEPHPRRIRAEVGGHTVLDTVSGHLLHESNHLPKLYVPFEDLATDRLERSDHTTHCPFKGDASYWTLRVGDRTVEKAVWAYEDPIEAARWLDGFACLDSGKADRWLEEDEEVLDHLRDPYHRVDVLRSSRRVTVRAHGELVAETSRALLLFETGHPVRAYLPPEDVDATLTDSDKTTVCPYKGVAGYRSLQAAGTTIADGARFYAEPLAESRRIAGLLCFAGEGIEVEIEPAPADVIAAA
jgi:uncharacterized protein (DUF427 family)